MSSAQKEKIGFIGLGNLGTPMAVRLLDAGYPLAIYDIVKEKMAELGKRGVKIASSCKELAATSDVIITMVSDDAALEASAFGDNGSLAGARAGSIFIVMSTVSPRISSQVATAAVKRGIKVLRAPVLGSVPWAQSGALTILASGDKEAYDTSQQILSVMGQKIFYLGDKEEGLYLKLAHNMMVAMLSQAVAEAMTFGEKAGLDWRQMIEIIGGSPVAPPVLAYKVPNLAEHKFTPTFTVYMMAKDIDLAIEVGRQLGTPMPALAVVRQIFCSLQATGREDLDYYAPLLVMEELAGIKH